MVFKRKTEEISLPEFLRQHIRNENDAKLAFLSYLINHDVIFVGETHTTELHREKLAEWMNDIKAAGVKYIGVEWLANTPEVNKALENRDVEFIKAYLAEHWGKYDPNFVSSALDLINSAWTNNITIVPLDVENAENQTKREYRWNENLKPFFEECGKDPQSKILIICGSGHADLESQANILREYNGKLKAGCVDFCGGSKSRRSIIEQEAYNITSKDSTLKDAWIVFSGEQFSNSCNMLLQAAWAQPNTLTIIMPFIETDEGGLYEMYRRLNDIRPEKIERK
ncbi:MAG: hypothetical protein QXL47_00780 [Candidatus Anstonellales archaeon]